VRLTEAAADLAAAAGTSGVAATPASASSSNSSSSALTSSAAPPEFVVASEASGLEVYRIVAGGAAVEKIGVGAGAEPGSAVSVAGGPGEPGGATPGYMAVRKMPLFVGAMSVPKTINLVGAMSVLKTINLPRQARDKHRETFFV
jgi:hypothetical protein